MSNYRAYSLKRIVDISDRKRKLSKLAAILTGHGDSKEEATKIFKDNVAKMYSRFMDTSEGEASIKEIESLRSYHNNKDLLETTYKTLTFVKQQLENISNKLDGLDDILVISDLRDLNGIIQSFRPKIRTEINNLKIDETTSIPFKERKHLGATIDRVLDAVQRDIGRLIKGERIGDDRIRMQQTIPQMESFILQYGDLYGIKDKHDWAKLGNDDPELQEKVLTKFLGLRRYSFQFKKDEYYDESNPKNNEKLKAELKSRVDESLKKKVMDILHPEQPVFTFMGKLPKRPPGK